MDSLASGFDFSGNMFLQKMLGLMQRLQADPAGLAAEAAMKAPPPAPIENHAVDAPGAPATQKQVDRGKAFASIGAALKPQTPPPVNYVQPGNPGQAQVPYQGPDISQLLQYALQPRGGQFQEPKSLGSIIGRGI